MTSTVPGQYVPAAHAAAALAPGGHEELGGHAWHAAAMAVAPVTVPKEPAGHSAGADRPADGQYAPAGHVVLAVALRVQYVPDGHWVMELSLQKEPEGQLEGEMDPAGHTVPVGHAVDTDGEGQYRPGGHAESLGDPGGQNEPTEHGSMSATEGVPGGQ